MAGGVDANGWAIWIGLPENSTFRARIRGCWWSSCETRCRRGSLKEVLAAAGESRPADLLIDDGTWSSYSQWRALLEAAGEALGGPETLRRVSGSASLGGGAPEFTEMLQSLGSPSVLFREVTQSTGAGMTTVSVVEGEEVGPTEWLLRQRFADGLEPFAEYCSWSAGLWELTPRLFGYTNVDVVEEECALRGAPSCQFRVRWDDSDDAARHVEYLETRTRLLESRLESLQDILAEVVSVATFPASCRRSCTPRRVPYGLPRTCWRSSRRPE